MRLFLAIDLPEPVKIGLERLITTMRQDALIKWSPLDNLHITTKFIGEWPEARLEELHEVMLGLKPRPPFTVEVRDLGWFPNERAARVLWAGVHGDPALLELARDTEEALVPLGIKREERGFSPQLTLARIKNPVPLQRLRRRVQAMQNAALGSFLVSRFVLFRSDPGSNASLYRRLREYPLETLKEASTATGS